MTAPVSRSVVEAFYEAYISRDPQRIGALLDDDVEWHVTGPAEVMQVCGHWQGKAAVIERFERQVPKIIDFKSLQIDHLLVDGDHSAMFGRITCVQRQTSRLISHRVAHVARYYERQGHQFPCHQRQPRCRRAIHRPPHRPDGRKRFRPRRCDCRLNQRFRLI